MKIYLFHFLLKKKLSIKHSPLTECDMKPAVQREQIYFIHVSTNTRFPTT